MARPKLLIWIFAGFCAAFFLAACVLGVTGTNERGIKAALAATGRLSFLLFWPAYTGSALVTLFGPRFQPIRHNGREFGLPAACSVGRTGVLRKPPGTDSCPLPRAAKSVSRSS